MVPFGPLSFQAISNFLEKSHFKNTQMIETEIKILLTKTNYLDIFINRHPYNFVGHVLKAHCRGADWVNKTIGKKRIRQD